MMRSHVRAIRCFALPRSPLRGENRRESEHLTKTKDVKTVLAAYLRDEAKEVALAFLDRDPTKRLGCRQEGDNGQGRKTGGVADIKAHRFFADIDWDRLIAQEMEVPFECDVDYEAPKRQPIPKEFPTQLDYFCQMVDYMKTSMAMRSDWKLKPEDQAHFNGFDYVSNKARPRLEPPPRRSAPCVCRIYLCSPPLVGRRPPLPSAASHAVAHAHARTPQVFEEELDKVAEDLRTNSFGVGELGKKVGGMGI